MKPNAALLILATCLLYITSTAFSGSKRVDHGSPKLGGELKLEWRLPKAESKRTSKTTLSTARFGSTEQEPSANPPWASHALLISSFTDGVVASPQAQDFLRQGLLTSLLSKRQQDAEQAVETSVLQSPCCGPDIDALDQLQIVDEAVETIRQNPRQIDKTIEKLNGSSFRFLYIPTAMYALRADSNNSPGKQRQRARADGKKRRKEIANHLNMLLPGIQILSATLDLDDASVKQPQGSDDPSLFPKDGKEALQSWSPHFIYVEGGNTFWLCHCVEKGDWAQDIVDACTGPQAAVYCGKSAGAILAGKRVDTATWKGWDDPSVVPGMEKYSDWETVEGLRLVGDISFFPHMSDDWDTLVKEKLSLAEGSPVECLREEAACCVNGIKKEYNLVCAPVSIERLTSRGTFQK